MLLNYFLRGLLVAFPLGVTVYLTVITFVWLNSFFNNLFLGWFDYSVPGMGILVGLGAITLLGVLITQTFARPMVVLFERKIRKMPIISLVYSSLRDLTEAFVGEKKKFTVPVKAQMADGVVRFGFITKDSLAEFGLDDMVAVYCPHSYNFSGNLYIFPRESVSPLAVDPTDFMQFIVSGGVTKVSSAATNISAPENEEPAGLERSTSRAKFLP